MTTSLIRAQEFWDSPKFRNVEGFTLEEYMDWYVKNEVNEEFDYLTYTIGMNLPSSVFFPFFEGRFDPLSESEKRALDKVHKVVSENPQCSVVASFDGNLKILRHEIAHGLFYTNPDYRTDVREILKTIHSQDRKSINQFLVRGHYHHATWLDETHAYVMFDLGHLRFDDVKTKRLQRPSRSFKQNFKHYFDYEKAEAKVA
jgi:hypothetical protein